MLVHYSSFYSSTNPDKLIQRGDRAAIIWYHKEDSQICSWLFVGFLFVCLFVCFSFPSQSQWYHMIVMASKTPVIRLFIQVCVVDIKEKSKPASLAVCVLMYCMYVSSSSLNWNMTSIGESVFSSLKYHHVVAHPGFSLMSLVIYLCMLCLKYGYTDVPVCVYTYLYMCTYG